MTRMWMSFRQLLAAGVLTLMLALACGTAVAHSQTIPVVIGSVQNPSSGAFNDALSATDAVATQDTAAGWYAYAPSYYNDDLAAISLADPTNPTIVGEAQPPGGGTSVYGADTVNIFNGIAYVVSKNLNSQTTNTYAPDGQEYGNALTLFDVSSNPALPRYLGSISDTSSGTSDFFGAYGITVTTINGTRYALVAAQGCLNGQPCPDSTVGNDLAVVDVSNPDSPKLVGSVANATSGAFKNDLDHATSVAVSGNFAYVTSFYGNALTVVDISDPTHPTVVWTSGANTSDFPAPADVAIQGHYAYVANQNALGTFTVLDISGVSDATGPTVVGTVSATALVGGYRVRVTGTTAYVSSRTKSAVTSVDVTDPANPVVVSSVASSAHLFSTTGLDLMTLGGTQYVVASSPLLSWETPYTYPPYPSLGNTSQTNTGTISTIELESTPVNTSPPAISGSTVAGQTLTAASGSWTGDRLTFTYHWERCDPQGINCTALRTTGTTYPLSGADVGYTIRAVVRATNGAGSASATSVQTAPVTVCPVTGPAPAYCAKPRFTQRPTVTGTTKVRQLLGSSSGSWAKLPPSPYGGSSSITLTVRWLRCNAHGARCVPIAQATNTAYRTTTKDLHRRLRLRVIAQNRNGSTTVVSSPSPPVAAANARVRLTLTAPAKQRSISRGFIIASIRSTVGALVDVFVGVQVGHGTPRWTTGTPAEVRPGAPVRFKVLLSKRERARLARALAAHHTVTGLVTASSPHHHGIRQPKSQFIAITG